MFLSTNLYETNPKLALFESNSALLGGIKVLDCQFYGAESFSSYFSYMHSKIFVEIFMFHIPLIFFSLFLCVFVHFLEVSRALCQCLAASGIAMVVLAYQTLSC